MLAQCSEPGATVAGVAQQLDISRGLIYLWRKKAREEAAVASEPLQFIPFDLASGTCLESALVEPVRDAAPAVPSDRQKNGRLHQPTLAEELLRPHVGARPGSIDVDLSSGIRLSVDSYVNEKALARVLRALKETA